MTGRELIVYILKNGLEDEPVIKDGKIIGFMTIDEFAAKMGVGISTVSVWIFQGRLHCVRIGGMLYIPADFDLEEVEVDGY